MPVRPLSPGLAEKAKVELNEDPKKLEDDIEHLKEWIAKQPHLRARTADQWLAAFLRGCKFSLERTKEKIDLYFSLKSVAPDLYDLPPTDPKFIEVLKLGVTLILPKARPNEPRVFLIKIGLFDPSKYTLNQLMSIPYYLQKILYMEDDNFVVAGVLNISDMKGSTLAVLSHTSPATIKKMMIGSQEAMPIRLKGLHFMNTSSGFETIFNLLKSFLNEKNRNRIHVYSDLDSLHKQVSKDILPAEYGGNGGTEQEIIDYWVKKVEEYKDFFEEDAKYGTDESKRPGKPKTAEEMFGLEGSFRKLDFD